MFISIDKVTDWRDLQSKVCQLFSEMGYRAEVEKVIDLAGRGKKEVDVYVEDPLASHNQKYLIECKYWESNIHQDVVHSFKTVMEGAGASTGFIISKRGFQQGAYEAARYTNINLVTFEELQHLYGDEWFRKQNEKLDKYLTKLRHIYTCHFEQFSNIPILNNAVFTSNGLSNELCHYAHWVGDLMLTIGGIFPENYMGPEPVQLAQDPTNPLPKTKGCFEIGTVREYFKTVELAAKDCIEGFDAIHKEARKRQKALTDEQFDEQNAVMFKKIYEEMPLRVLKDKIPNPEFEKLISLLFESTIERIKNSD